MDLRTTMGTMTGNPSEDIRTLYNYVFQLTEEMRYLLNNLDVTNFNDLGLARYENGRLQVYSDVVEVRANKIESVVEALGEDVGVFETWAEGEITGVKTTVRQTADSLSAVVEAVGRKGTVDAASIVAAINDYGSEIKLNANRIDISGITTFTSENNGTGDGFRAVEIDDGAVGLIGGEGKSGSTNYLQAFTDGLEIASTKDIRLKNTNDNVSIEIFESGDIYMGAETVITLTAGGTKWRFYDDGLYMGDEKVLPA